MIGDPVRLRAALENLIDNAVKFTERGGVRLAVTASRPAPARCSFVFTVPTAASASRAAEIRRLFRPFAQANEQIARRYGGAGLGLASVKRLAKAMGGDLDGRQQAGRRQPLPPQRHGRPGARSARCTAVGGRVPRRAAAVRPLNILCAEDNPYGRVVLNTILTELGHRADFVGTGDAAVEAVAHGGYDVVLMDVTLPGIDGRRSHTPHPRADWRAGPHCRSSAFPAAPTPPTKPPAGRPG